MKLAPSSLNANFHERKDDRYFLNIGVNGFRLLKKVEKKN